MAEFKSDPLAWAEEHPYATAGIVFVGGLALLYMLGYIGSGSSAQSAENASTQNMAAAYYAAEAAQTQAGTALNIATVQANAQTQGTYLNDAAAVAINASNNTAATTQTASMYNADMQDTATTATAATNQAQIAANLGVQQAAYGAQTAQVQANDALSASVANSNYAYLTNQQNDQAAVWETAFNTVIPQEVAQTGNAVFNLGGYGTSNIYNAPVPSVTALMAQGYTQAQANMIAATSTGIAGLSTGQFPA